MGTDVGNESAESGRVRPPFRAPVVIRPVGRTDAKDVGVSDVKDLMELIKAKRFMPEQVFNTKEMGLF